MAQRKALILTYGSRGDVEPFVALALGLADAGFDVSLATADRFRDFVGGYGIPFHPITSASLDMIDTPDGKTMIEGTSGLIGRIAAGARTARKAGPINAKMMNDAWAAARTVDPDLIVFHPKILVAPHIAEKLGIPLFMGILQPMMVPTRAFAASLRSLPFPGFNRMSYRLVRMSYGFLRKSTNAFRTQELGLPPVHSGSEVLMPRALGSYPVLHAISPLVLPRPDDWPENALLTGYWRLPEQEDYSPPRAVADFLDNGPPPVFVGFGSMTSNDPESLARCVVDALRTAGQRGVIAGGWAGLAIEDSDDLISAPPMPYRWLFPRMAAVVHHGGAGTTAEGLHAGVPSVICPFFADQPFWGQRTVDLGVGATPVPRGKLTADRLAGSIREAVSDPQLRANAQDLASRLAQEDGVETAIAAITERLCRI